MIMLQLEILFYLKQDHEMMSEENHVNSDVPTLQWQCW